MMSFVKKNKYILVAAAILLAGSYGGYKYYQSTQVTTTAVKMGEVKKGNIMQTVSATGALSAQDNVDISSKITGRIVEVLVKENQHVNAGDVLVRLDATSLNATLAQMQAKLHNAQANYERNLNLLNRGAISQSTFDSVEADYLVAKSNYEKAASDVNDTVITTPISGYIIGKPTPVGQTISSGISTPQVIMSVATLDNMEIEALVDESDIGQVKDGQKVKFTVDAYPDDTFTGRVMQVRQEATTNNNVVTYEVVISAPNSDLKLKPGLTASVTIYTSEKTGVTCVPSKALRFTPTKETVGNRKIVDVNAKNKVWVLKEGSIVARKVSVGMTDGIKTQILDGVSPGESIISDIKVTGGEEQNAPEQETSPFAPGPPGKKKK